MRFLINQFRLIRYWDLSARVSLVMALILLVIVGLVMVAGPEQVRIPALIGFIGLVIVTQGVMLWGNRFLFDPVQRARELHAARRNAAARDVLLQVTKRVPVQQAPQAHLLLAQVYRAMDEHDLAQNVIRRIQLERPDVDVEPVSAQPSNAE